MRRHCLLRSSAECLIIQNRAKEAARLRRMKQPECNSNLRCDKTTRSKTMAKIVVELVPPTCQKTSATYQAMPPICCTNNLCPVSRIGGKRIGHTAVNLQVVLNTLVAPDEIQQMQMVWNALGV